MYSLKDRAPSYDPTNMAGMTVTNTDNKLHPIESLRTYDQHQKEKEIIYPLKGNSRIRPISAAMNKKYLKGFYNTVDMKFGTQANLQNNKVSNKNIEKRSQLLQYIG